MFDKVHSFHLISTLSLDSDEQKVNSEVDIGLARQTTAEYLSDLRRIYVIEDISGNQIKD